MQVVGRGTLRPCSRSRDPIQGVDIDHIYTMVDYVFHRDYL